ncbi:hypothetical protein [Marivita sp. XM-24bin2]|jgi:hypothetical protein|uniref:hypothetical protein n=1 Tax=unclassified Marivita TaxID=2632480 RepID=UPI0025C28DD6|nr:hypothetical protein [Marivita sp. XM-24bin2]MCR9108906.1 hypothetical protein [Paracoccaceae bacterium]
MTDLIALRRHRFDALHKLLTGDGTSRRSGDCQKASSETVLCLAIALIAAVAMMGLSAA